MDKPTLVESDLDAGALLVRALDEASVPVRAALWLYMSEPESWRLVVATPLADKGPDHAYSTIQTVLEAHPDLRITLSQITAVSPKDKLIKILRRAIATGPGISGIRFSRNVLDGQYIEDAYIYRVA